MKPYHAALFSICFLTPHIEALPKDLRSGDCCIFEGAGKMVIESADGTHLKWASFNIDAHEALQFMLPSERACVINQVVEHNPSQIMGSLLSNGRVFLLNPAGVLIGKGAKVDTAAFIVSTFDHIERCSKNALGWKVSGKGGGKITIEGLVTAQNGPIVVIGESIECQGTIQALNGSAYLLGTEECFIGDDDGILWTDILPGGSEIAVNGKVFARAQAQVLAHSITMEESAILDVSGFKDQSGGTAVVKAVGPAHVFGHIAAKGGELGGDGGFIEVSGGYLNFQGTVDTTASQGKIGHLLLDPLSIRIGAVNSNVTGASPYTPTASPSIISTATLNAALALANVTVQSTGAAGADPGNVFIVDDYITASPVGTTLTLLAFNNIEINAALSFLSPGSIVLNAPNGTVLIGNAPTVPAQTTSGLVFTNSGNITISALNDVILDATSFAANVISSGGTISVTTTNGDVQVLGGSASAQIGSAGAPSPVNVTVSAGGDVVVAAGTGPNSAGTIGLGSVTPAGFSPITGDISVTAVGDVNVTGGSGIDAYGLIGFKNGTTVTSVDIDGTVTVRAGGGVNLQTGTDSRANAMIGLLGFDWLSEAWNISVDVESNGPFNLHAISGDASAIIGVGINLIGAVPPTLTVNSPFVRVVSHSASPCQMTGSTSLINGRALIGFLQSGSLTSSNFPNINAQTAGDLQFNSGFSNIIGFSSDVTPNMLGNVAVDVGGDLLVGSTGGHGVVAVTAVSPGSDQNTVSVTARNILASVSTAGFVLASSGPLNVSVANDIQLQTTGVTALIQFSGLNGVSIAAGNDIITRPGGVFPSGAISFGNIGGAGPIYMEAGRDITFTGALGGVGFSTVVLDFSLQTTTIDVVAGRNLALGASSGVVSASFSPINLVCDNQFPTSPQIGPGTLTMHATALVGIQFGSEIRLFTARQNQNIIAGQFLNGAFTATGLVPGPLFGDVPPEKWGIYYFNNFYYTGSVFTILYKQAFQSITEVASEVVSEGIFGLNDFDEYLEWPQLWNDSGKRSAYFKIMYDHEHKKSKMRYSEDEDYWLPRRKSRFLQHPQVYRS